MSPLYIYEFTVTEYTENALNFLKCKEKVAFSFKKPLNYFSTSMKNLYCFGRFFAYWLSKKLKQIRK